MYCFVRFQKGLRSVFDESSQTAWFFCTTSNIYRCIPTNSHKTLTNYIPVFPGRIILSIGENRMKIRAVVFRVYREQTDRQTRRRTLFYNMYRYYFFLRFQKIFQFKNESYNVLESFYLTLFSSEKSHWCAAPEYWTCNLQDLMPGTFSIEFSGKYFFKWILKFHTEG